MSGPVAVAYAAHPGVRLRSATRLALCAAVSWYLCLWWGTSTLPVPAVLPAVLIMREDVYAWPRLGRQRLAGVVVGVLLSTVVLHWVPDPAWSFPAVLVCGCAGMYLMGRPGAPNQQVVITALMVYATAVPGYPLARLAETLVGIAVVLLLGPLLWPPDPYRSAAAGLDGYRADVRELLGGMAGRLERGLAAPGPAEREESELPEQARVWLRPQAARDAFERAAAGRLLPGRRARGLPPDGLDGRLALGIRTALTLQYFGQELGERARTDTPDPPASGAPTAPAPDPAPDPTPPPDPALRDLAPLVRATAAALDAALLGEEFTADLDRAIALDLAHREAHPDRHDAVLRAGLHLTHEALADHAPRPGRGPEGGSAATGGTPPSV
ncbi:aromatic acid exporter family protein [Streptomyces sp. NPDC059355]|uniref:aromatic acid exporter family protein n=1 Tax=Streptomyces sp. NPDC059355 TaxID=3346811 RepID=UPI0036C161C6